MLGWPSIDRHLTIRSGFLDRLLHGDLVLTDRGFDISDDLTLVGASLAIPPITRGKPQLSQREVERQEPYYEFTYMLSMQ